MDVQPLSGVGAVDHGPPSELSRDQPHNGFSQDGNGGDRDCAAVRSEQSGGGVVLAGPARDEERTARAPVSENKFHRGARDGRHYWLTPPDLMASLQAEFAFDFDACPFPLPAGFDGLTMPWGGATYVNPPFGSIMHEGKRKGMTAWVRKALAERAAGKTVVVVYPLDKWVLMLLAAGAEVTNLGDVRWLATEDGKPGAGTGRHIARFVLRP